MKVLTEGHKYLLENFEKDELSAGQNLQFIEKRAITAESHPKLFDGDHEGEVAPGQMYTVNNGTTNEELLAVLINRMEYLNGKFPCDENAQAITNLKLALKSLESRTAGRTKRGVEGRELA